MNAIHPLGAAAIPTMANAASRPMEATTLALSNETQQWTLRRTGRKPVRFNGCHVIESLGAVLQEGMWYDLNFYRTEASAIIVELTARRAKLGECDLCRVEVFVNMTDAASWLQSYRCVHDIPAPACMTCGDVALAHAVVQAVRLRQHIARVEDEYQAMLCDVFAALGLSDAPDEMLKADPDHAPCA